MSARSGLVGKKSSRPYLGQSEAIFSIGRKNQKMLKNCLFSLVGQWAPTHPVWALAAIHQGWGNRKRVKAMHFSKMTPHLEICVVKIWKIRDF